jgi:putative transposase
MEAVTALAPGGGLRAACCAALGLSRASLHRRQSLRERPTTARRPRPSSQRALGIAEHQGVLDLMREPRFVDLAPAEIYATLLDEGVYRCSLRTLYRVLAAHGEVRERRDQLRHPVYKKPELRAEGPNQIWSWDIAKLMGPAKGSYFYLYVILDIFSRRVVGWQVADAETAALFKPMFDEAVVNHDIAPGQLTLHADRGAPMKAKATALLLADLGVTKSHSRPYTSNDNPFSESHFKTLKYQPQFPRRFGCIEDAKILSSLFRRVQQRPSSRWHRVDDAKSGAFRPGRRDPRGAPGNPRPGIRRKSRTLRRQATKPTAKANRSLDQPASPDDGKQG